MFSFFKRTKSKSSEPEKKNKDKTLTKSVSLPPTLTTSPQDASIKNKSKPPAADGAVTQAGINDVETPVAIDVIVENAAAETEINESEEVLTVNSTNVSPKEATTTVLEQPPNVPLAKEDEMAPGKLTASSPPFCQTLTYASALKKPDTDATPRPPPPRSVKPCSHVTLAATPRAIVYGTKKENICTPTGNPMFPLKKRSATAPLTVDDPQGVFKSIKDEHCCKVTKDDSNINGGAVKLNLMDSLLEDSLANANNNNNNNIEVAGSKNGCISPVSVYDPELDKKNLINQEAKFQSQINDLSKQLLTRDADAHKLRFQIEDMERDNFSKSSEIERLQTELDTANKESALVQQKLRDVEAEIVLLKKKTNEMAEKLLKQTEDYTELETESKTKVTELQDTIRELQSQVVSLEVQMDTVKKDKEKIEERKSVMEKEREEERTIVQDALEQAMSEKESIQKHWEQDFEKLRTVNTDREQHLMDDFEWKLREIEKTCKRKLEEKDKKTEQKIAELEALQKDAETKLKEAQDMMTEVTHLKSYQAEVTQLRGLTQDQIQSLQYMAQQNEDLLQSRQNLEEEAARLRNLVEMEKENIAHVQHMHSLELLEKERKIHIRMDQQKNEVAMFWEDRLREECCRLKSELDQLHNEEKHLAVESLKIQKEQEFMKAKQSWERRVQDCVKEISALKDTLTEKDEYYHAEFERTQTNTDQEILELRRLMDKIDMTHHERFEKLVESHEEELEKINEETERRIKEIETSAQLQVSSMRATLELVKEQMERENEDKIEILIMQHKSDLDKQWANLIFQKSESVRLLEDDYSQRLTHLEDELDRKEKVQELREADLLHTIDDLKDEVQEKDDRIKDLINNVDTLQGGVQVLNTEIISQGEEIVKVKTEADKTIRELRKALLKQQHLKHPNKAFAEPAGDRISKEEHEHAIADVKKQNQAVIDQLQRKCQCLTKLFEEIRSRYDKRESRPEDLNLIADLRQIISEQEKDLACLNEEKRYFQMELMKLQNRRNGYRSYPEVEKDSILEEDEDEYDDAENDEGILRRSTDKYDEDSDDTAEENLENNMKGENFETNESSSSVDRISLNCLSSIPPTIPE